MRILLFGKNGQLGWELQRSLAPLGEIVAVGTNDEPLCGDLTDLRGMLDTVRTVAPDVIVNAAAHTAVDKAEMEPQLARAINALAPAALAAEAQRAGAWLVHYSTDYVFDGTAERPYVEADSTNPLSVYGTTKRDSEQAIMNSGCHHLIFRTSWVYSARGGNFAKTMLRLAHEKDRLTIINDQFGAPTGADLLADVTAHAIRASLQQPALGGLYHLTARGETSWHGYATYLLDTAREAGVVLKVQPNDIEGIPTSAYPTPAQRPKNSRLNSNKLQDAFDLTLPAWQSGVRRMLTEILEKQT